MPEKTDQESVEETEKCKLIRTVLVIVKMFLAFTDFWSDILLGISYAKQGETVFAAFTFLFTLVPTASGAIYVIYFLRKNKIDTKVDKIVYILCLLLQTHFVEPLWLVADVFKKKLKTKCSKEDKEKIKHVLSMFNACEALPQLAFQFCIILGHQGYASYFQFHSIFISTASGCWALTDLLNVDGILLKILLPIVNFCWVLPGSVTLGLFAYHIKTISYIVTVLKILVTVVLNMFYIRRNDLPGKEWSEWVKSVVFSLFVPFYMFSKVGAYVITAILFSQIVAGPTTVATSEKERPNYNITDLCPKCFMYAHENKTGVKEFFDILFDSEQKIDMTTMYDYGGFAVLIFFGILALFSSFCILREKCFCCVCLYKTKETSNKSDHCSEIETTA